VHPQTRSVILDERPGVASFSLAELLARFGRLPTWALIFSGVVLGLVLILLVLVVAPASTNPGPMPQSAAGSSVAPKRAHLLGGRSDPSKSATLDKKNKKRSSKRSDLRPATEKPRLIPDEFRSGQGASPPPGG
jgi:hypothetical protein